MSTEFILNIVIIQCKKASIIKTYAKKTDNCSNNKIATVLNSIDSYVVYIM